MAKHSNSIRWFLLVMVLMVSLFSTTAFAQESDSYPNPDSMIDPGTPMPTDEPLPPEPPIESPRIPKPVPIPLPSGENLDLISVVMNYFNDADSTTWYVEIDEHGHFLIGCYNYTFDMNFKQIVNEDDLAFAERSNELLLKHKVSYDLKSKYENFETHEGCEEEFIYVPYAINDETIYFNAADVAEKFEAQFNTPLRIIASDNHLGFGFITENGGYYLILDEGDFIFINGNIFMINSEFYRDLVDYYYENAA